MAERVCRIIDRATSVIRNRVLTLAIEDPERYSHLGIDHGPPSERLQSSTDTIDKERSCFGVAVSAGLFGNSCLLASQILRKLRVRDFFQGWGSVK
jgi:hypothetical protein